MTLDISEMSQKISLSDSQEGRVENYFTLVSGENGVGKSLLLRALTDAALETSLPQRRFRFLTKATANFINNQPTRILALSGTPNDRFPNNSGSDIRSSVNRFDVGEFYYFGPKHSGGIASSARAASSIAQSIIISIGRPPVWKNGAGALLKYLGLGETITVKLRPHPRTKKNLHGYLQNLSSRISAATEKSIGDQKERIRAAEFTITTLNDVDEVDIFQATENWPLTLSFNSNTGQVEVDRDAAELFESILIGQKNRWAELLLGLVSLGVMVADIEFANDNALPESIDLQDMSSGQWQLLNSLFNLSATILDGSLILIDEPENSLHPQWQRNYISLVREVIAHARECHVIIATHSPLLVSSLLPDEGVQVHLSKGEKGKIIYGEFEPSAYGWIPGDVLKERFDLDTQRPPELAKAIKTALSAIRQNDIKSASFKSAVDQITLFSAVLPSGDPINPVLDAIFELSASPESEVSDV